ncbi:hypothetical protein BDV39DRAFT_184441 [Aspergillus sergii]|uniref:Uncharacterized protein n=1 Tax=Aspergillus sergii TaxID=1034303 RepID=A0A5N6WMH3_9EURO|nr:hypothetical protein BDV39DRAFT_184441 [Aspergillus sergii]
MLPPRRFLRSGGISDIMHGIYYVLFILQFLFFSSFFIFFFPSNTILPTFIPIPVTIGHEHIKSNPGSSWAVSRR